MKAKWFIRFNNKEDATEYIIPYFREKFGFRGWKYTGKHRAFTCDGEYYSDYTLITDYEEITIEEFKKLTMQKGEKLPKMQGAKYALSSWDSTVEFNPSFPIDEELVSYGHVMRGGKLCVLAEAEGYPGKNYYVFQLDDIMERMNKVRGYKCPIDLFGGNIKKGEIFEKVTENSYKTEATGKTQYSRHLPKEIVETWEPVYEDEFKEGDFIVIVKDDVKRSTEYDGQIGTFVSYFTNTSDLRYKEGYRYRVNVPTFNEPLLCAEIRKATKEEILKYKSVEIKGYKALVEMDGTSKRIAFGCQKFTLEELNAIKKLFDSNINASVHIGGQEITLGTINKLITLLHEG